MNVDFILHFFFFSFLVAFSCCNFVHSVEASSAEMPDRMQGEKYLQLSEIAEAFVVVFAVAVVTIVIGVACLDNDTGGVAERDSGGGVRAEETRRVVYCSLRAVRM